MVQQGELDKGELDKGELDKGELDKRIQIMYSNLWFIPAKIGEMNYPRFLFRAGGVRVYPGTLLDGTVYPDT